MELALAIAKRTWKSLQVVTNSFPIVQELMRVPGVVAVFVGGTVNREELAAFGVLTEEILKHMSIHKLFIGCRGINPETGLSNDVQAAAEIATVRALAAASQKVYVLADHTKFERTFLVQMLPIGAIDGVVTDSLTPEPILQKLRKQVRRVVVAPVEASDQIREKETG